MNSISAAASSWPSRFLRMRSTMRMMGRIITIGPWGEVGPNDVSGGNINYELGMSSRDTVELRDGSILNGDLESVSATEVVVFIGGNAQHLNRNQVKRILLVERDTPPQ